MGGTITPRRIKGSGIVASAAGTLAQDTAARLAFDLNLRSYAMTEPPINFDDGAAYERMMGKWSQLVGNVFVDWLNPAAGLNWIDVGCGNGAFTQILADRCAPATIQGIDPAEGQLAFARERPAARIAQFHQGDASALPFPDEQFDAAVMALVIFYVPDPAMAVGEMVRVTKPGGRIATYVWDMLGGGSPTAPIQAEIRAMGAAPLSPPSLAASRMEALQTLWSEAGLVEIQTREIVVTRDFAGFDDFWATSLLQPNIGPPVAAMAPHDQQQLKSRVRQRFTPAPDGRVSYTARANAIAGRKPT
jgi:SAM-dependent methyltransferase